MHFLLRKHRAIWEAIVDRAMTKPNCMDGSTASRAIPAPHDKTWLEEQNLTNDVVSELYCESIQNYRASKFSQTGQDGWTKWKHYVEDLRRKGNKAQLPY